MSPAIEAPEQMVRHPGIDERAAVAGRVRADGMPSSRSRLSWARLLKRVFFVDALSCPRCNLAMVVLAFLSDPAVVGHILRDRLSAPGVVS